MKLVEYAAQAVRQAEGELRKLLTQAATSGDYESAVHIAAWARTLGGIVDGASSHLGAASKSALLKQHVPASVGATVRSERARKQVTQSSYPRFRREGDRLVRVAWSKSEKKEYEHKAPRVILTALANAMLEKGSDGRLFSTEQILPLYDEERNEIPSYQAYVGIALLKQVGLVDQHGRRGYSIPELSEFENAVEIAWRNLPEK